MTLIVRLSGSAEAHFAAPTPKSQPFSPGEWLSDSSSSFSHREVIGAKPYEPLQTQRKTAVIPSKRNCMTPREYDKKLYKVRHLYACGGVKPDENCFAIKQYRAIATRCAKRTVNFLGAIYLAASVIWLNG